MVNIGMRHSPWRAPVYLGSLAAPLFTARNVIPPDPLLVPIIRACSGKPC